MANKVDNTAEWTVKVVGGLKQEYSKLDFLDLAHPVGSLYWSKNPTNPAELFGGTWEQIKDTFILAAGDTYGVGATGGAATVALTVAQLPAHNHSGSATSAGAHTHTIPHSVSGGEGNRAGYWLARPYGSHDTGSSGAHSHTLTINNTGSNQAHENMPPYIVYYCWERTA